MAQSAYQQQLNRLLASLTQFLTLGMTIGALARTMGSMKVSVSPQLLPQTRQEKLPTPEELLRRLEVASEMGDSSLVDLVGSAQADRLEGKVARLLSYSASGDLRRNPFSTLQEWLEPAGEAHRYPELLTVAQKIIEAAEKKLEKARDVPQEVIDHINYLISLRTSYGIREEITTRDGTVIVWSSAQADWYTARHFKKGMKLRLDANYVFVPYSITKVEAILPKLEPLPLYKYSLEAISRKQSKAMELGLEKMMESDDRWLEGLRRLGHTVYVGVNFRGITSAPGIDEVLADLKHTVGGNLTDGRRIYRLNINTETGTRFYMLETR